MTPQNSEIETRKIPEDQLEEYFANFTKNFLLRESTTRINLEVLGDDLGDQFQAEGSGIFGITYEPKEKALEFELDAGDHRILNPKEVWVAEDFDGFVKSIEVVTDDGTRQVATVKRGAVAPSASAQASSTETVQENRPQ
jgi:hypothetical protein